jgi:uncharacterized protein (UPF0335 family)
VFKANSELENEKNAHSRTNQSLQLKIERIKILEKEKRNASPSKKESFDHIKKNVPSYE